LEAVGEAEVAEIAAVLGAVDAIVEVVGKRSRAA